MSLMALMTDLDLGCSFVLFALLILSVAQMRTAHGSDVFLTFLAKDLHLGHVQQLRRLHRLFVCTQAFPVEQRDSQYGT